MINPNDFISSAPKEQEPEKEVETMGGTFICQECLQPVLQAVLDEDSMSLVYTCKDGHRNEASL
jgi:hypothetical protein